jgi:hypothetical protein
LSASAWWLQEFPMHPYPLHLLPVLSVHWLDTAVFQLQLQSRVANVSQLQIICKLDLKRCINYIGNRYNTMEDLYLPNYNTK